MFPASVYEVDGFETPARVVRKLHRQGRKVICYIDVGSWESYRPDKAEFPRSVIGRKYAGFPDERWLDVAHFHRFERPLKQRFNMCARKGFDGVEPDNVAGWEKENHTGFKITQADQLHFNRWVARQVHGRGMAVALKNDGRQAKQLSPTSTSPSSRSASSTTNAAITRTPSSKKARPSSRPSTNRSRRNTARPPGDRLQRDPQVL